MPVLLVLAGLWPAAALDLTAPAPACAPEVETIVMMPADAAFDPGPMRQLPHWRQTGVDAHRFVGHLASGSQHSRRRMPVRILPGVTANQFMQSSPVYDAEHVYVANNTGHVVALRRENLSRKWRFRLDDNQNRNGNIFGWINRLTTIREQEASLAVTEQVLVVAGGNGLIYGLDLQTGEEKWRETLGAPIRGAMIRYQLAGGRERIVLSTLDNRIMMFDPENGEIIWVLLEPISVLRAPSASGLTAVDGRLFAAMPGAELAEIDPRNGTLTRRLILMPAKAIQSYTVNNNVDVLNIEPQVDIVADPEHQLILTGLNTGRFVAIDLADFAIRWQLLVSLASAPVIAGDVVFFVTANDWMYAADVHSGQIFWRRCLDAAAVIMSRNNRIDSESSAAFWRDKARWLRPLVINNRIVMVRQDGLRFDLEAATGKRKATYQVVRLAVPDAFNRIFANPVMLDDSLLIVDRSGYLYRYH